MWGWFGGVAGGPLRKLQHTAPRSTGSDWREKEHGRRQMNGREDRGGSEKGMRGWSWEKQGESVVWLAGRPAGWQAVGSGELRFRGFMAGGW